MELMQGVKGYSDSREEEEEEEAAEEIVTREESSRLHQQQQDYAASNYTNQSTKQIDFMELSLGNGKDMRNGEANFQATTSSCSNSEPEPEPAEKEHMFDKVVTPSDVGKLNRLVIPKQHAEKYFPLDTSSNEKGLLLNFEDRNGKLWRFRYSYWNSSQSYVMTKGWSRFVKEKKLDAGDIVSFQRGVGDLYRHRLYIDWRRRPDHGHGPDPSTTLISPLFLPNHPHYSVRWGGRLYSLPSPPPPRHPDHLNYNNIYPFHHHYNYNNDLNSASGSVYYLRSSMPMPLPMPDQTFITSQQQQEGSNMIIDSVPVAHQHHQHAASTTGTNTTAAKRLRLFGVNMECGSLPSQDPKCCTLLSSTSAPHVPMPNSLPSSSLPPLHRSRLPHQDSLSSSARFGDQRGEPSMLFDLDPSLQFRQ